ncbi:MAG: penicillin acylase family protein, partial [Bacteroidota bacterium]
VLSLLVTVLLTIGLLTPVDPLPVSIGALLDPFHGFWQNAEPSEKPAEKELTLPELDSPVLVRVEERGVPHIFAENEADLYFVQGYLTAQDRLWEMDFMVRATGGGLAEVLGVGPDSLILNQDRRMRRKGMVYGAERSLEQSLKNPHSKKVLEAFSAGVNAYLTELRPHEYPIEYKLLGYTPTDWTPLKTYLLFGALAEDLSGGSNDMAFTHEIRVWGKEVFDKLHPEYPYEQDPILPEETSWPRLRELAVPPTLAPQESYHPDSLMMLSKGTALPAQEVEVGSNNWAVSPGRSASGKAMLADDPHLGLNLPSIWHEVQLSAPGINVYGVTLPGIPGVIIGFNDSISWGLTNAGFDVLDHYRIEYGGEARETYIHDGQTKKITTRAEEILVKDGAPFLDTVRYTHHGPVIYDEEYGDYAFPIAMRWTFYEPDDKFDALYQVNRSNNAQDFIQSLKDFVCPIQNFAFADARGQIGLIQAGLLPNRWPEQGRHLLDGRLASHDWQSFVPYEMMPQVINPEQGYIGSANQHPTEEGTYPYYYTANYEDYRGRRVYQLLGADDSAKLDLEDMKSFQLDNVSLMAADILPVLLAELDSSKLDEFGMSLYQGLREWDFAYDQNSPLPGFFEVWFRNLYLAIWQDEYQVEEGPLRYPDRSTTVGILRDSLEFSFYQKVGDSTQYDRRQLIRDSFAASVKRWQEEYPEASKRVWGEVKQTDIRHLARVFAPFSALGLPTDGNRSILNATTRYGGPSWRMVVSMESPIRAFGVYPGGQSGNPGSAHYDDYIEMWRTGKYFPLFLMNNPGQTGPDISLQYSFQPAVSQSEP